MGRRAKSSKGKAEPKRSPVRKPPENEPALVRDLEKRLAESLEREKSKDRALTEALEQQTATSEVLRIISNSPTDVQPVLEAVAENAARLCESFDSSIFRRDGDRLFLVAHHGPIPFGRVGEFAIPLTRGSLVGRSIIEHRAVQVTDLQAETEEFPLGAATARQFGYRTSLAVPLLRESAEIGAISIRRTEVRPFTDKQMALLQTFADQAVIAIENVRLFTELQEKNRALTEAHAQVTQALDQQTATSEILSVISTSPTDVQPVFDAIAESARQLCNGEYCIVESFDGERLHFGASDGLRPEGLAAFRQALPRPVSEDNAAGRAVLRRMVAQIPDVLEDPTHGVRNVALAANYRSTVAVPMLRDGQPIGAIVVARSAVGLFPERQVALLQTFADQAVIAIENVRLFTELQEKNRALTEALGQQTATAEVLKVISRSTFELQPVLDTLIENAARLCGARRGVIFKRDSNNYHGVAFFNTSPVTIDFVRTHPISPGRHTITARVALERHTIQVADVQADPEYGYVLRDEEPIRTELGVPMFRGDEIVGVIILFKVVVEPFTDKQIELVETFADQAVIAIENVRLFTELQEKNQALTTAHAQVTESMEQQTATSEILQVISSSPTDVQPVFDAIAAAATRLCGAVNGLVGRFDGQLMHMVAHHNVAHERLDALRQAYPRPADRGSLSGRIVTSRAVVHVEDVDADPEYTLPRATTVGYRSVLGVPMLREGAAIGYILVARDHVAAFSEKQIALLKTFADQAVIAIENARLFKELEARTDQLTQSVEKLTALGEVSRSVSSTLDVETVLDTIVSRASQLAGADGCSIYEYDEGTERFELHATHHYNAEFIKALRSAPLRKGEGLMGRAAEMREPIQIPDITQPGAYQSSVRDTLVRFGYRALLSVPLLREDQIIGSLSFNRKEPGEFPPEVVDVLKTFATQSALAIQNARLFREIEDKSRQLEAASRHKSEFLANMSHELRTPLNAVIGFSEVLSEGMFGEINEKQAEYLRDILESGRHLLSLINDILDLSKIEAGRMELEAADFDLPSAIDNALTLVRERATRRGITLGRTIDDRLGIVRGDERKVKQVFLNLLSNALKFTPEGGRINVSAHLQDGAAEIAVADTGVGIAPEDQEAIFEEFRQVGTADKKVEGTGLGLALSRKFIELHGGRVWVKSELGKGSTFTFTLPMS